MPRINLLPWREEKRQKDRADYLKILGACAGVAALILFGVNRQYTAMIEYQQSRNAYLTEEIAALDEKIKKIRELEREKERMIARMKAIETLQTSRPIIVHLFDELVNTLPEGVYLNNVQQQGDKVTITGVAQSNARVSNYMRNVEASDWVRDPNLSIIEARTDQGRRISNFTLALQQTKPKTDGDEEQSEDEL